MGDISEIRGLITVGTFLACLVLLIGLIPSGFFPQTYEGRTVNVPEYFEAIDIASFIETWSATFNESAGEDWKLAGYYENEHYKKDVDIGGWDFDLIYSKANKAHKDIILQHWWGWFGMQWTWLIWYNSEGIDRGEILSGSEIDEDYSDEAMTYVAKTEDFQCRAYFGFNDTKYSSPTEAWDNYELDILIGMKFDQVNTSINAWSLISMLLFFQLPEVHWIINALIAIPIWITVAYLIYVLIIKIIPFIAGG